jgi:sulfite reductase (NADPH) hemoprotein beta-component
VDKKGSEFYQISLGGNQGNGASLGAIVGPSVSRHEVADVVEKVLDVFVDRREGDETFLSVYRRIGIDPFKARIYDDAS